MESNRESAIPAGALFGKRENLFPKVFLPAQKGMLFGLREFRDRANLIRLAGTLVKM
jgi:hypothetical protein